LGLIVSKTVIKKILIVGLGSIGQRHTRNLRRIFGGEINIIAYRVRRLSHVLTEKLTIEPGEDVEKRYNLTVFSNLEDALKEGPDAAFICNPTSLHIKAALACARAGCHVFVEKPLSHTMDGVDDLLAILDEKKLVGMVGYQLRYHPSLKILRRMLAENAVGHIISVRCEVSEFLPGCHAYEDYRQGYNARRDLGGGIILSHIHEMDYLYSLFGVPRTVYAAGGRLSSLEMDVEDTAHVLMNFDVRGRILPVYLYQDFIQNPGKQTCVIIGEEGRIEVDFRNGSVNRFDRNGVEAECFEIGEYDRNCMFQEELECFVRCMYGQASPMVSIEEGVKSLKMAIAAKKSLETGSVVEVS
jgi:predicted dehydrogenase